MTGWAFFAARAAVAAFCLLTWAYGLIVSVRFAFEQVIRPQLFPWVTPFVTWHHAWYWGAFLVSAATLIPDFRTLRERRAGRAAGWLAVGYLLFFGAIGIYLVGNPYLVTLDGGQRSLWIVPGALLPLLWLAVIDHLGARFPRDQRPRMVTGQWRLFAACLATALSVWLLHVSVTALRSDISGGWAGRMATVTWALALDVAAALAVFVLVCLATSIAATRRRSFEWEYTFAVALIAVAITEFVRRFVLPSLAFADVDAAVGAIPFGVVMALMWSGWRVRQRRHDRPADTALAILSAPFEGRSIRSLLLVCVVPVAAAVAFRLVEQVDWALNVNRLIALVEAALLFSFFLNRFRDRQDDSWSTPAARGRSARRAPGARGDAVRQPRSRRGHRQRASRVGTGARAAAGDRPARRRRRAAVDRTTAAEHGLLPCDDGVHCRRSRRSVRRCRPPRSRTHRLTFARRCLTSSSC